MDQQPVGADEWIRTTERAADYTQETAKWLVSGLGAVGAALLAGAQFSGIGRLDIDEWRLWAAVGALFVALGSIGYALVAALQVLTGAPKDLDQLNSDEVQFAQEAGLMVGFDSPGAWFADYTRLLDEYGRLQDRHHPDLHLPRSFNRYERLHDLRGELQVRQRDVARLAALMSYYQVRLRFNRAVRRLFVAGGVAAISIVVLAWAANPAEASLGPPSAACAVKPGGNLMAKPLTL